LIRHWRQPRTGGRVVRYSETILHGILRRSVQTADQTDCDTDGVSRVRLGDH